MKPLLFSCHEQKRDAQISNVQFLRTQSFSFQCNLYPRLHEHLYPPNVLTHECAHPPLFTVHSLISKKKDNSSTSETGLESSRVTKKLFHDRPPVGVVVKDICVGAVDTGFDSRAGHIGHSDVNGSPPL